MCGRARLSSDVSEIKPVFFDPARDSPAALLPVVPAPGHEVVEAVAASEHVAGLEKVVIAAAQHANDLPSAVLEDGPEGATRLPAGDVRVRLQLHRVKVIIVVIVDGDVELVARFVPIWAQVVRVADVRPVRVPLPISSSYPRDPK